MTSNFQLYLATIQPATDGESHWRHQHWWERRQKVIKAMSYRFGSEAAILRFVSCGADAAVEYSATEKKHRVRANYCKSRHCEPCMRSKGNLIAFNIKRRMVDAKKGAYRFITLTLRHDDKTPLLDQIKRIYRHFRCLRTKPLWKQTQKGGVFTLEVKLTRNGWHVHLHIIAEGTHINVQRLSELWQQITGDSFVVDARFLDSLKDAAHYVAKYVAKGTSPEVWDDNDRAQEWLCASRGVRVCATLGSWRGHRLAQPEKQAADWQPVGRLDSIVEAAKTGEPWAQAIILSLRPGVRKDDIDPAPLLTRTQDEVSCI